MKKLLGLLFLLSVFLLPATTHAQMINSQGVPNANFNSTTPAAPQGTVALTWLNAGPNVIAVIQPHQNSLNVVPFSTSPVLPIASGGIQQFSCTTPGAAITATDTGFTKGLEFTFIFVQNATTACTFTFPANIHGATTVSATLSSVSVQTFVISNNGTDAYAEALGTSTTGGAP